MRAMITLILIILMCIPVLAIDIFRFSGVVGEIIEDSDHDGVIDSEDLCPDSVGSVDDDGCTAEQFCASYEIGYVKRGRLITIDHTSYWECMRADWKDNEMSSAKDCKVIRSRKTNDITCVARKGAD